MRSCGCCNVRKHKEIKNGEQYIFFEISLKFDCPDKREVTNSGSRAYVGRSGKGLTNSMNIRTRRRLNKKQNSRTSITDISSQYFMKLLEEFKYLPYLCYRKKLVKSEPTEAYFFLFSHLILNK